MRSFAARVLLLASLVGSRAVAQSLVNATFSSGLTGWSYQEPIALWTSQDANGSPVSGSVLVTNTNTATSEVTLRQCVTLSGGRTYDFGAKAKVASGQAATGGARTRVLPYPTENCSGPYLFYKTSSSVAGGGEWSSVVGSVDVPADAKSLSFLLVLLKNGSTGQFQASFDDAWLVPAAPTTLTVPSSASIHGNGSSFFHSDLWVMNHSPSHGQTITARYRCFTGQACPPEAKTFLLAPRQSMLYADVVGPGLFAAPETAGAIELTYDRSLGQVSAASRVYTPSLPAPTNGTAVPALESAEARTRTLFVGLGSNGGSTASGFRSNAGAYNPGDSSVSVTFTLYNGPTGTVLGRPFTRTWAPHEAYQINNVFAVLEAASAVTTNAYLVVTASAPVFPFVTVIDNQSGDSVWVRGVADAP